MRNRQNTFERKKVNGEYYIKNAKTNRWMKALGRTAQKYLLENNLPAIGNIRNKKNIGDYVLIVNKMVRGWRIQNFSSQAKLDDEDVNFNLSIFCNGVLEVVNNLENLKVLNLKVRASSGEEPNGDYFFYTIKMSKKNERTKAYLMRNLVRLSYSFYDASNSDTFAAFDSRLDTSFFQLQFKQDLMGNSGRKDFTVLKTDYFKCHSFPAKHGDCLLSILRKGKHISKIRKDLGLKGGIKIDDMEKIENYFGVNIDVYNDTVKIKKIEEDTPTSNKTIVKFNYDYFYKSKNKNKGEAIPILLKDEHYSLIVSKKDLCFDPTCGDRLEIHKGTLIPMSKLSIKKSLIRQGRKIAGESFKDPNNLKKKLLFFDIETVFNPFTTSLLEPYSVSWRVANFTKPVKFTEENILKYENKTHFTAGKNCMRDFVQWIENNEDNISYVLVGYNNSRFDNFPLLKALINADIFTNMMYVQNSILDLKFSAKHKTFDLCRFVMSSLDSACKNFNVYPKKIKGFSHYEPQNAFNKGEWNGLNCWINKNYDQLKKYNKIDVLATENLFYLVRMAYMKMTDLDITDYLTLASLSFAKFKETCKIKGHNINPPLTHEDDEFIRSAIVGGRCQVFNVKVEENEKLGCVDVKSLYPYVMLNRHYPCGDEYKYLKDEKDFTYDKLGIYRVKILKQPKIKVFPERKEGAGEVLNWDSEEEIIKTATSIELECLERHGGEYEFIKDEKGNIGIFWEKSTTDLFTSYFLPIKEEKTRQDILAKKESEEYNPALRNISKLLLNSLSGKQVQRNFEEKTEMIKNNKEEEKFMKKTENQELILSFGAYTLIKGDLIKKMVYNRARAKPSYIGVFIYAHARTYMYDLIYSNYETIYTDTDSGVIRLKDYEDFSKKYIEKRGRGVREYYQLTSKITTTPTIGGEFGQFEEELSSADMSSESYFIAKKLYCIEMKDKNGKISPKSKYRMKGVGLTRDRMITREMVDKINSFTDEKEKLKYQYELKQELDKKFEQSKTQIIDKSGNTIETAGYIESFRELNKNGVVYFLCGQIKKINLELKQAFSIKIITKEGITELGSEEPIKFNQIKEKNTSFNKKLDYICALFENEKYKELLNINLFNINKICHEYDVLFGTFREENDFILYSEE